ncbi:succinylglutamate desuccinylase/aspartoacylase family protein [Salinilacihabitans rarus]|uniref:succinylglutamate desuccinylase/aspartoacylase family protein n=1 Tax=Salinilacihabitans rarus TaxID=2961596 RepID=UPI0020C892B8|nr:succinylglutamate desuccinylase/aspartoacylase family protein [Salinilacihabitans rarus]
MNVGTASAAPGERATGTLEVTDLPTGGAERLPVILARGEREGPTLWLTGGIHGNEVTGVAAVQDVLRGGVSASGGSPDEADGVPEGLRGTVVCVPMCNPAGIRRVERTSYYHDDDPNRHFPPAEGDATRRRVQELIDERLYEAVVDSADALLDVHTAQVGSVPFVIRDRVLHGERREEGDAEALAERLAALADATGIPVVTEYPAEEYADRNLHRSTAGAVLNEAGVPSLTVELGGHETIAEPHRAAGVAAAYRAMVHLGMLDAVPEGIEAAAPTLESPVAFPVRRFRGPNASAAGFCRPRLEPGAAFAEGDPLADVVSPHGEARETVAAPADGYVLGWPSPTTYENDPVASLAVRDDDGLVVPRS